MFSSCPNEYYFFTRNFASLSLFLASFITWMSANWAALSSVGYNPSSVLVKIFGHFILVFIVYFMSGFNSHQLRAVPAAVIACCQNCRCISTRLVLSVREKCSRSSDQRYIMNVWQIWSTVVVWLRYTAHASIWKEASLYNFPHTRRQTKRPFLEFGASLCHRNSKRLVVKSCRKFTFLLKSQNSPQIQTKQNKENMRTTKETTLSLALFTTES